LSSCAPRILFGEDHCEDLNIKLEVTEGFFDRDCWAQEQTVSREKYGDECWRFQW